MAQQVNPRIFRQYDVRGVVDDDLTESVAEELGKGYGAFMRHQGKQKVSVGYDARPSSPGFRDALIKGILSTGIDIVNVGMLPTPTFYFSLFHLEVEGGVMITGSHNPPEFNGFKLAVGRTTIYGDEIQKVRKIIEAADYPRGVGQLEQQDVKPAYLETLKERIGPFQKKVKLIVDAGNGVAGMFCPQLLQDLGAEAHGLYCEVDGTFPNHHPDPTVPANLTDLIARVMEEKADLGMAYDGDGDRLGVVDEEGNIIWGDQLLILFSREILARQPGAPIIFEVKCSQALAEEIEKAGGVPIMWRTGHSFIKKKMREENSPLAGEMSGHLFFADEYYGYDDAIYASLRLVRLLSRSDKSIREMLADVPKYYSTPEIRVDCPDEEKFQVVAALTEHFKKRYEVVDVDGARILFGDGWGLVRASNTQPVLVLRFEAKTPERLDEIQQIVLSKLKEMTSLEISI
ncbi:MAG: phosphomannomutase [Anaerolineae bacterium]|nr:phosphomannomutase [Anaerolineae bacterium]NIO00469.1 phosphomannomutase [Anaerolineae bacterium]NIQ83218.1 phosphomannomutase [Anaerolineae bacterium]